MFYFIEKLRSYLPDFIITQPTFGYPQVDTRTIRIEGMKNFLDSGKQLHHQQQLGCGREEQKCGRYCRPHGL